MWQTTLKEVCALNFVYRNKPRCEQGSIPSTNHNNMHDMPRDESHVTVPACYDTNEDNGCNHRGSLLYAVWLETADFVKACIYALHRRLYLTCVDVHLTVPAYSTLLTTGHKSRHRNSQTCIPLHFVCLAWSQSGMAWPCPVHRVCIT